MSKWFAKHEQKMGDGWTNDDICQFLYGVPVEGDASIPVHKKTDVLPYDTTYEILPSKFTIDNHVLGRGAFGIVKRGTVRLLPNVKPVVVAVKTTDAGVDVRLFKALLSEIKLMIHLAEAHENVVALLGACTQDLRKRRAYLFLEFCKMGNLETYLRKNKHTFATVRDNSRPYANVPAYLSTESADQALTTLDLYHWSIQISQGLKFLKSKEVVHGDLATRNVLLASRSLAKISDFGLSRRVENYSSYVKDPTKPHEPLPWKWMAVESLQELTFSTKSDIWGYGVTLWEIFSLGSTPYPGLGWSTEFANNLVNGLRLPQPPYGTHKLYNLLLKCWNLTPSLRPSPETILEELTTVMRTSLLSGTDGAIWTNQDIHSFFNGDHSTTSAHVTIPDKIDSLPYDTAYEIPCSKFTIDDYILGGYVHILKKGSIKPLPNIDPVPVAVKTVAEGVDVKYVKELLSELKRMIYIGTHENVVILLGACTTDLDQGKPYLFFEYCKLGTLELFLRENEHAFTFYGQSFYQSSVESLPTDESETGFTELDLYNWSSQIASGLDFLETKGIVHGDLGTRNILLANQSLAKIGGLSCSWRKKGLLAWAWMAIESLQSYTFSSQSDIWSYGVTVWEIFTLGGSPYQGMSWTTDFAQKIVGGLRLPPPTYEFGVLYELLLECWNLDPALRPTAKTIVANLALLKPN